MADQNPVSEKESSASHTRTLSSDTRTDTVSSLKKENETEKMAPDLESQTEQKQPQRYAFIRYTLLNIYRRLFSLVFFANLALFIAVMVTDRSLLSFVNAAAANLVVCGLARQPLVVNAIFLTVCSIPRSAPLRLRRIAAKAYHYGGVHSGCGIAAFVWYVGLVALVSQQYWCPGDAPPIIISTAVVVLSYIILALLLAIIVVAYPAFRFRRHDYFELTHRFSGWLVVALFLALLLLFANEARQAQRLSLGRYVIQLPAFWFLMVTIVAIIHPWLMLRKLRVRPEVLSRHAVRLHFDHTTTTFGKGIQLSKHPLQDWHGFATFPDPDGQSFSCLVSKAGDWTADCIQNPPTHLWKRGVLIYGFAYAMRVFRRVIVVTTGSGIGPCLSFLGDEHRPALRVVWQTRSPLQTYGQAVIDLVRRMDPDPLVIDTDKSGRVDMLPIVRRLVGDFEAEAVCVISNPVLTKNLVFGLEARGVPAFGPIFDS
ncbi:hypothetical protein VTN77DRAFT_1467 [Rasamsonia byssochlamydoides]|uniref:uncharacterized protein n=1 Tax=Rasamsonia byssochlamydoides TaxID=89139 RepID=UPI003741F733